MKKRNVANTPWLIPCDECKNTKNKSVPAWLTAGISMSRAAYMEADPKTNKYKIETDVEEIKEKIKKAMGPDHTKQP